MITAQQAQRVAAKVLRTAVRALENRACNDFNLGEVLGEAEVEQFIRAYHEWNRTASPDDTEDMIIHPYALPDWAVALFLADYFSGKQTV